MSLSIVLDDPGHVSFPRVSGDEPGVETYPMGRPMFSPRERG